MPPSPLDLTTLASARAWIGGLNTGGSQAASDQNIQACITAASFEFLRLTGRGPMNWQTATQSPFVQPVDYVELYSGNGNPQIMLRNFPVNSISQVTINGASVPASSGPGVAGYQVGATGRGVVLSAGGGANPQSFWNYPYGSYAGGSGGGLGRFGFSYGNQNVQVSYNAGFAMNEVSGELQTVIPAWQASHNYGTGDVIAAGGYLQTAQNSGTSGAQNPSWNINTSNGTDDNGILWSTDYDPATPNTIVAGTIANGYNWLVDGGVKYFSSGNPLTAVQTSPAQGQYRVQNGVYLFNAADAGQEVLLSYSAAGTPADIVLAINQLVALNYSRRNWVGVRSIAMKDVGSTSYSTWAMDAGVKQVFEYYTRRSI